MSGLGDEVPNKDVVDNTDGPLPRSRSFGPYPSDVELDGLWIGDTARPDDNPKSAYGIKKPPLHLIPPAAKVELAAAMGEGARKYGPYNWRENSVAVSVYLAAAQRHFDAYWDGEEIDPESGVNHLGHAMACCGIVLDAIATGNLIDDRPKKGVAGELHRAYANRGKPDAQKDVDESIAPPMFEVGDRIEHKHPDLDLNCVRQGGVYKSRIGSDPDWIGIRFDGMKYGAGRSDLVLKKNCRKI